MGIISDLKQGRPLDEWVAAGGAQQNSQEPVSGYRGYDKYPAQFQAAQFPLHGEETRITGNNQAFFFVQGVKGADNQVADIQENTSRLKELIGNIVKQGDTAETRPSMHLQIDADVFENKDRFVDKYQALRAEPDEATRRALLGKEVDIIRNFVQGGGIKNAVKEVFQNNATENGGQPLPDTALESLSKQFLEKNFKLEGVKTPDAPLQFATWEVVSGQDVFLARQEYKNSTHMTERPWQLGTELELSQLAGAGHTGAQQVITAATHTRDLETIDLTFGQAQAAGTAPTLNAPPPRGSGGSRGR